MAATVTVCPATTYSTSNNRIDGEAKQSKFQPQSCKSDNKNEHQLTGKQPKPTSNFRMTNGSVVVG